MKRILPFLAAIIALVAACSAPQPEKPAPTPDPTPTPIPPTPPTPPEPSDGIESLTVSQFIAKKDDATTWYRLNNLEVVSISSFAYGDLYVRDDSGLLYIYGLAPEKDGNNTDFEKIGIKAGDVITVVAHRKTYNGVNETDKAYFEKKTSGKYPGTSAKKASSTWLELPSTANNSGDTEFLVHFDNDGKRNYSINYDKAARVAKWVCYPYVHGQGGSGRNNDPYAFDPLLSTNDQPNLSKSYDERTIAGIEYIRGHMVPSNDRSGRCNYDVFLSTNICPQATGLNSPYKTREGRNVGGIWGHLEYDRIHKQWSGMCDTLYVVTGTVTKGSTNKVKDTDGKSVVVPVALYKAVLAHSKQNEYRALGAYFENTNNPAETFSKENSISIDELEKLTGEDFFCNLPDDVEKAIEAAAPKDDNWWWN